MDPTEYKGARHSIIAHAKGYDPVPMQEGLAKPSPYGSGAHTRSTSHENLLHGAAGMGAGENGDAASVHNSSSRSRSPPRERAPRLPDIESGGGMQMHSYR